MPLDYHKYATPFLNHEEGDDIFISPRSIMRMTIERTEVPWTELRFETMSKSNSPFVKWVIKLLLVYHFKENKQDGLQDALKMSMQIKHEDLKFLISSLSIESHTFCVAWGSLPTLEDVVALIFLPRFGNTTGINVTFDETDKKKFEASNNAYSGSSTSNKSTYASWLRYFEIGKEENSKVELDRCCVVLSW